MKHDVVIIGSGLGGLECALLLARAGRDVLVLEQGARPGGSLQSYRRRGMSFDTGFHYVGGLDEGQSLHAAFRCLGLSDLPWRRLDPEGFDRVRIGGKDYAFAQGFDEFARRLADDFPSEREALQRYADMLRRTTEHQWDALRPGGGEDFAAGQMETGAWAYLTRNFRSPLLTDVLGGASLKMELRRESLPLFTFAHGNAGFVESSWRLAGDGDLIVRRLADGLRAAGGTLECGARVTELRGSGGRLTRAVCADGRTFEADLFVSDAHPALTCQLVRDDGLMRPSYRDRVTRLENTCGMFTVSLRLRPHTLPYFNWNQYVYREPDVWTVAERNTPVRGLLMTCRVPEDGGAHTTQVDLLTPMRWEQCREWEDTRAGRRDGRYRYLKERVADECLELAETVVPGLRSISRAYTSTPLTWRDYTLAPEGSAYGVRKDYRDPLGTLLSTRTPVPNLLLTGQSLMLHGLHGVTTTAFLTCAEVLGRETVRRMLEDSA